jgi:hypothetical protein
MSASADILLYSGSAGPTHYEHLDCLKCLEVLMPHLDQYRKAERTANSVAEVRFSNGLTMKFASKDGHIEFSEQRPIFGSSRKWLGMIPAPARTEVHTDSSDFAIHKMVSQAYGTSTRI